MSNIINEEINSIKFLFGYERGRVMSEQANVQIQRPTLNAPAIPNVPKSNVKVPLTPIADVVGQIQTLLNTKYGAGLVVDKKWGPLTQAAFDKAFKGVNTGAAPQTPPASTTQTPPASTTQAPPAATTGNPNDA